MDSNWFWRVVHCIYSKNGICSNIGFKQINPGLREIFRFTIDLSKSWLCKCACVCVLSHLPRPLSITQTHTRTIRNETTACSFIYLFIFCSVFGSKQLDLILTLVLSFRLFIILCSRNSPFNFYFYFV